MAEPTEGRRSRTLLHQGVSEYFRGWGWKGHREESVCPSRGGQSATWMARDRWRNQQVAAQGEGGSFGEGCDGEQGGPT